MHRDWVECLCADLPGLGGGAESREEMEQLMSEAIPFSP